MWCQFDNIHLLRQIILLHVPTKIEENISYTIVFVCLTSVDELGFCLGSIWYPISRVKNLFTKTSSKHPNHA